MTSGKLFTYQESDSLRSQTVILEPGRGKYRKFLPYAFTEQGVAMLSGILQSHRAVQVNIAIMRAFVRMRRMLVSHEELARKVAAIEGFASLYMPSTLSSINGFPASSLSTSTPYIARNARPTVRLPFHLMSKALNRSPVLTTRSTSDCARERQK